MAFWLLLEIRKIWLAEALPTLCLALKHVAGLIGCVALRGCRAPRPMPLSPQQEQNIKPQFFAFRWLTLLLSQEFLLPDVIRIWDSLFADDNRFDFLLLVCCAMLM